MNSLENLQGSLVTSATSLSESSNLYVMIVVDLKSHILHLEDLFFFELISSIRELVIYNGNTCGWQILIGPRMTRPPFLGTACKW
jgi:hypothetical protein